MLSRKRSGDKRTWKEADQTNLLLHPPPEPCSIPAPTLTLVPQFAPC